MSWRQLGFYNSREHWTIYLLATASNLFLSIPLYLAARAGVIIQLPVTGRTAQFISAYGITWGLAVDFLWTLLIFQGILAVLVVTLVAVSLIDRGWKWLYIVSALGISFFVGYWLGDRFLMTLSWISLLQNSGIDSSSVYSGLFWYGLGATIFYVTMVLVLRRSYNKLAELKTGEVVQFARTD